MAKKIVSKRAVLFDNIVVSSDSYRESLPLKKVETMHNISFFDGKFESTDHDEQIFSPLNVPIKPPPVPCHHMELINAGIVLSHVYGYGRNGMYKCQISSFENEWKVIIEEEICSKLNIEYEDEEVMLFAGAQNFYTYSRGVFTKRGRTPSIFDMMCSHYGRVFGADTNWRRLYFSDEEDPLNWNISINEGGYITFDVNSGLIVGLASFNDYVYVFSELSIYRVTAYADQESFSVKKLDVNIGKIIYGSVVKCNGIILFLTSLGLMAFDGYNTKVISTEIEYAVNGFCRRGTVYACSLGYKYYLTALKTLYVYDTEKNTLSVYPFEHDIAVASKEGYNKILVFTNFITKTDPGDKMYYVGDAKTKKRRIARVKTHKFDFGAPNSYKIVKNVTMQPNVSGTFTLIVDGESFVYDIGGDTKIVINKRGKVFQAAMDFFRPDSAITSPVLDYDIEV